MECDEADDKHEFSLHFHDFKCLTIKCITNALLGNYH